MQRMHNAVTAPTMPTVNGPWWRMMGSGDSAGPEVVDVYVTGSCPYWDYADGCASGAVEDDGRWLCPVPTPDDIAAQAAELARVTAELAALRADLAAARVGMVTAEAHARAVREAWQHGARFGRDSELYAQSGIDHQRDGDRWRSVRIDLIATFTATGIPKARAVALADGAE